MLSVKYRPASRSITKSRKQYRTMLLQCALASVFASGLSGCGDEATVELSEYVKEVKARHKSRIPPLPTPQQFEIFNYNDGGLRNPFEPTVEIQALETNNGLQPDMVRNRDVLEQYALGSLKMMGSLEKNGRLWALIWASDGTLFRTTVGKHLGKNNGRILAISESEIELMEIVPDGLGGWIERTTTLAVSE
ncbi:MAG: pilus assembly protein PilP [Ectothiorhodospiraceae bacterium]|nr:pilus assembly protein PilP [Ectothiorhodospiraceae bacterium]